MGERVNEYVSDDGGEHVTLYEMESTTHSISMLVGLVYSIIWYLSTTSDIFCASPISICLICSDQSSLFSTFCAKYKSIFY